MTKSLLINPSYSPSYAGTKVSIVNPVFPTLGLATIAAAALQRKHEVEILDLSWRPYKYELIRDTILKSKPDIVGITATTPLMNQLRDISVLVKNISKNRRGLRPQTPSTKNPLTYFDSSKTSVDFVSHISYKVTFLPR